MMERNNRKVRVGTVIGDKMEKTRVVEVVRTFRHPTYKKVMRRRTKFYAHDEQQISKIGDTVKIMETRPLSKLKRWRLVEIVEKAK